MINHAYKELYMLDNVEKQLLITFTGGSIDNTMLLKEEFELQESICTSQQLVFGSCESAMLRFMVAEINTPLKGKTLTVSETLNGDTATPFQFGIYKVDSDKPTANRAWREVIAYDALYEVLNADVAAWYNALTFPMTLKALRDSFFSYFNITQETVTLANDSMTVTETIAPEELSGKTVINAICEINGCFGHINRSGNFAYIILPSIESGLFPADDLYPADNLYPSEPSVPLRSVATYKTCEYEDYKCSAITQLQIRQEENDIGAVVGTSGNTYVIEDNFLVYGKSASDLEAIATNILPVISGRTYRPFTLDGKGNPCTEVGDIVRIYSRSQVVESYVLQRTLNGIQALQDSLTATGEEICSQDVNSVHSQIKQLKGKTNVLTRTVDETRSELTSLEESTSSRFTQTAKSIEAEVTRAGGAEEALASSISAVAGQINLKVTKGDVVNQINLDESGAVINANKIKLEGYTTINGNFSVDEDGNMKITTGDMSMTATSGQILIEAKSGNEIVSLVQFQSNYVGMQNYTQYGNVSWSLGWYVINGVAHSQLSIDYINGSRAINEYRMNQAFQTATVAYAEKLGTSSYYTNVASGDGSLAPSTNGTSSCGTASHRWSEIYASNGTINTSDKRQKKNISPLDGRYLEFLRMIQPRSFEFIDGTSGRAHIGFIAQDIEIAMTVCGLSDLDFAGFIKSPIYDKYEKDGVTPTNEAIIVDYVYGLRYTEFVALLTYGWQETETKLSNLIAQLKERGVI